MIVVVLMGMVAGGGIWVMARGWWPSQPPLAATIEALGMTGRAVSGQEAEAEASWWHRVVRSAAMSLGGDRIVRRPSLAADLALVERPPEAHAIDKLQTALFGAALPAVLWVISSVGSALPAGLVGVSSIALGVGGWFLADHQVAAKATRRRHEFRLVLATYLRLVTVLLAGGSGTEEALQDAAGYGTGWGFSLLRRCVTDARLVGRSPWSAMQTVAERTALDDLAELAGSMTLAGEAGAQVRRSLDASATALTERELADVDARAASRTERMNAPIALLVIFPGVYSVVNL